MTSHFRLVKIDYTESAWTTPRPPLPRRCGLRTVPLVTRKELLDRALEAVGGNEAELAQRLGIKNVNSAATEFNRYRRGESMKFERTIALLQIAGLLRDEPAVTRQPEAELLDHFDAALTELAAGVYEEAQHGRARDERLAALAERLAAIELALQHEGLM